MKPKLVNLVVVAVLALSVTIAAAPPPPPTPNVNFTVLSPLPDTMVLGQSYDFVVEVTSDAPFISALALPTYFFPGRYVTTRNPDRAGAGTTARLTVTFTAKNSTAGLPGGVAPVSVVVGVRFMGGVVVSQQFDYNVSVP